MDVIGVGGIDFEDNIARFSSRGMTTWVREPTKDLPETHNTSENPLLQCDGASDASSDAPSVHTTVLSSSLTKIWVALQFSVSTVVQPWRGHTEDIKIYEIYNTI